MRRRLATMVVLLAVATGLALIPSTPAQAGEGSYPVVLIPGWLGQGDLTFQELIPKLQAQGLTVIDFDQSRAGTQALSYAPSGDGQHISYIAGHIVEERIQAALAANGYPADQKVDVIAHSMGGLVSRFLVEQPGADVDSWDAATGWYGNGTPDVRTDWAARVDNLIMIGTPNHGTWEGWVGSKLPDFVRWNTSAGDMAANSRFLTRMGYAEKPGELYTTIGGDPSYLRWLAYDYDGDGYAHGFDGVVPAESPYLTGSDFSLVPENHLGQVGADATVDLVINALGYTSTQTGIGNAFLAGTATVRLEYAKIVQDHDFGTTDDYRFDVYVDPDGGNDGYTYLNTIAQAFDGPTTKDWGDTGPSSAGISIPGISPRMDVKLVVWEDDGLLGREPVSTVYFTDLLLSEDIDGLDHYQSTATDTKGGTNTFRVSVNGVTAQPGRTRLVTFTFDKALVQQTLEVLGNAEAQFTLHAGRDGYAGTFYRGYPDAGTHYSRAANTWVTLGSTTNNKGQVESKTVFKGRMLDIATWRFDAEYFDDDGGWTARDSGGRYQWTGSVASLPVGTSSYTGTAHAAWDAYLQITTEG